jgi:membrane protein implicated in regulation of membrane protease activity
MRPNPVSLYFLLLYNYTEQTLALTAVAFAVLYFGYRLSKRVDKPIRFVLDKDGKTLNRSEE